MAKPWEKYSGEVSTSKKPWEKYATEEPALQKPEMGIGEGIARTTINQLPLIGSVGAGMLATPGTLGVGTLPAAMAGGAAGAALKQTLNNYFFDDEAKKQAVEMQGMDKPEMFMHLMKAPAYGAVEGITNEMGGQLVGKGIGAIAEKTSPMLRKFAVDQSANFLGATKAIRNKLGPDKIAQMGAQGLDTGVVSPLVSAEQAVLRNKAVQDAAMLSRKGIYSQIDEAGASSFNPLEVATKIDSKLGQTFNRTGEFPTEVAQAKQLDSMTKGIMNAGDQNISMTKAQDLIEALGKEGRFDATRSSATNDIAKQAYREARNALNESAASAVDKVGTPGLKQSLEQVNQQYSNGIYIDKALNNKIAGKGNKMIGLTDTIAAAPSLMHGLSPGSIAQGIAVLGAKKGAERFGNQMLATGANNLSKAAQGDVLQYILQNPQLLQPAAKQIMPYSLMNGE